jgi:hypothetical protein
MIRALSAATVVIVVGATHASGQTATQIEIAVTGGASTQSVGAAATQVRVFGEPKRNLRFFLETAWATQSGRVSDAFGGAYPYDGEAHAIETYGEFMHSSPAALLGVRAGRYRTPFGLHARGDHAYNGYTRPPLIRYDDYFGLSNNFLEGGVNVVAGIPALRAEISLGAPQDVGEARRRHGLSPVVRMEGYVRGLIVGASHMRSRPYDRRAFVQGDLVFTGVDLRYMRGGYQIRGEWISGRPFDNVTTTGWYLDGSVHRSALGPVTLVGRVEQLDYDAGRFSRYDTRYTAGARIRLPRGLVAQVAASHQPRGFFGDTQTTALDAAVTWVLRVPGTH